MIPESIRDLLASAVKAGRYSVLLGAGYSSTSTSADGTPLPVGDKLRDELVAKFDLEPGYNLALLTSAIPPEKLNAYFQQRFKGCKPSLGAQRLAKFVWKNIYTFNVDDVLQSAYTAPGALQKPKSLTFHHDYWQGTDVEEVATVHLHGSVLFPEHGYVFSPAEYGQASAADSTWFKIASDEIATEPLIILGSNHFQESDLEYYLARRKGIHATETQLAPSLFVSKTIDKVKRINCEQRGLVPIEASSDEFLEALQTIVGTPPTPIELALPADPESLFQKRPSDAATRVFFRQWLFIKPDELPTDPPNTPNENLLKGTEPRWSQILRGDDVLRAVTRTILADVVRWRENAPEEATFVLAVSPPGDGKTTLLMRVGLELSKSGELSFWYHSRERLLVDSAVEAIAALKRPPVLLIDRAAEHGHQISDLLSSLRKRNLGAFVLSAERSQHLRRVRNAFPEAITELRLKNLTFGEATAVIDKMRPQGLLGRQSGKPTKDLAGGIVNQSWFVATVVLNRNLPTVDRVIDQELTGCDDLSRRIYSVVSLAHLCGYPTRLAIIQRATRATLEEVMAKLKTNLYGLIVGLPPHGDFRQTRHQLVAEAVVHRLSQSDKFAAFEGLASALAPYVTRQTLIVGTDEARLAARLLDFDDLLEPLLGRSAAEALYAAIKKEWGWNSRYWEQLALLKLDKDPLAALHYAETATGIERHPVPLTTLAKVRYRLAQAQGLSPAGLEHLREAIRQAKTAIDIGHGRRRFDIYPFDVGLRGITEFYRKLPRREWADVPRDVSNAADEFAERGQATFKQRDQTALIEQWEAIKQGRVPALRTPAKKGLRAAGMSSRPLKPRKV